MQDRNFIVDIIEFFSLIFLGIIMIILFMHLMNGTLGAWVKAKFHATEG